MRRRCLATPESLSEELWKPSYELMLEEAWKCSYNLMTVHLRCPIQSLSSSYGRKFFFFSSFNSSKAVVFSKPTAMNTNLGIKSKRPSCPDCTKPLSICLCSRFKTLNLDNQVNITILQHNLEKKHPLNSTRIVKLGLKNLSVATVFDVNFEASFDIQPLEAGIEGDELECTPPVCGNASERRISISIEKYGKISSVISRCMTQQQTGNLKLEEFFNSSVTQELMEKGFIVKKFQRSEEAESLDSEEFEIAIPPGTAVLFPSKNSVGVKEVGFSVKNLIVLDGTWAKANRIYNENPWLRLLPCVRLDVDKESLYREVRNEPKPGFLSTLESIVYALEAFGEKKSILDGLENLLQVFESMVEDQRRCMKERLESEGA